jgi:solute carrier family 35 protein E1
MPLFTVIMSTIILKESHSYKTYLSLLPIVGGVLMATVTELSFDLMGMLAATLSTLCFAVQNIYTKKSMREVHMHHLRLLLTLNQLATLFIFPVWMYTDAWSIISNAHKIKDIHWLALVLPVSGLCGFVQSVVAFSLLSFVSPISYSVINAAKRIFVISASLLLMKNPVTAYNVVGMVTAISGVALYNKIKSSVSTRYDKTFLPLTTKETLPLKII